MVDGWDSLSGGNYIRGVIGVIGMTYKGGEIYGNTWNI